jgi:hypothetical protein
MNNIAVKVHINSWISYVTCEVLFLLVSPIIPTNQGFHSNTEISRTVLILYKSLFGKGVLCCSGALFCLTTHIVLLSLFLCAVSRRGFNNSLNFHESWSMQFYSLYCSSWYCLLAIFREGAGSVFCSLQMCVTTGMFFSAC